MQSLRLLLALASAALASQVQVTPVQKVVQLLENMKEKGTKEMQEEEAYFEKLKPDCLDTGASYAERQAQRKQEARTLPARFIAAYRSLVTTSPGSLVTTSFWVTCDRVRASNPSRGTLLGHLLKKGSGHL
eukprot:s9480_g2.t1